MVRRKRISGGAAAGAACLMLLAGSVPFAGAALAGEATAWAEGEEAMSESPDGGAEPVMVSEERIEEVLTVLVQEGVHTGLLPEDQAYDKLISAVSTGLAVMQRKEVRDLFSYEEVRDLADEVAERSMNLIRTEPDTAEKVFKALEIDETGARIISILAENWEDVAQIGNYLDEKLADKDLSNASLEEIAAELLEDVEFSDAFVKIMNESLKALRDGGGS